MPPTVKILVACHRPAAVPDAPCYLPVEVGAALHEKPIAGFARDDTGENISAKNPHYCELTAAYWAWKNLDADIVGLVHYRRYFTGGPFSRKIAEERDLLRALEKAPLVLPPKRHYWIETNYSQYIHAHHKADLDTLRAVLAERSPAHLAAYERQMRLRAGHRFNMFVMRRDLFDAWCAWLFPLLFEVEARLDISGYDPYSGRVFGFLAERLLDVWVETEGIAYTELPVLNTEPVNWFKKGGAFVLRKLRYGKREDP